MQLVAGFLVVGIVIGIAAFFVVREAGRIARHPPPALFDVEEAFEWVVAHVPDDVAATLTPDDVRRILDFQVEFFKRKGVSSNGHSAQGDGPVVVGGAETVEFVMSKAEAVGSPYTPAQVHAVLDAQMAYLETIGAMGPTTGPGDEGPPRA